MCIPPLHLSYIHITKSKYAKDPKNKTKLSFTTKLEEQNRQRTYKTVKCCANRWSYYYPFPQKEDEQNSPMYSFRINTASGDYKPFISEALHGACPVNDITYASLWSRVLSLFTDMAAVAQRQQGLYSSDLKLECATTAEARGQTHPFPTRPPCFLTALQMSEVQDIPSVLKASSTPWDGRREKALEYIHTAFRSRILTSHHGRWRWLVSS